MGKVNKKDADRAKAEKRLEQEISAGQTEEELARAEKKAEGMSEFAVSLFLAHSEYEMFVEQMSQAAAEQAAASED